MTGHRAGCAFAPIGTCATSSWMRILGRQLTLFARGSQERQDIAEILGVENMGGRGLSVRCGVERD